jgi:hypothetical protein
MVEQQVKKYISENRTCSCCGKMFAIKGHKTLAYRTLFGKLSLKSARFRSCSCQKEKKSFSPLSQLLVKKASPELMYLESKWASLMSYEMTAKFLKEVFPLEIKASSIFDNVHQVATRLEQELKEEEYAYIKGCPREWGKLPKPDDPLIVGIDGGYVHKREKDNRKAGSMEVIVGKIMQEGKENKRFGFVTTYDEKPKRRLYEMLKSMGLQMNQRVTFLSDGGESVHDLQLYLSPEAEHILDWFHITMRITNMKQIAKGIKKNDGYEKQLDRAKWYLWHGNVFRALETIENLLFDLEIFSENTNSKNYKLWNNVSEFYNYIKYNSLLIPNYGDRYRNGEVISTSFVESTVNEVISKRMVKQQQMRWTKKGAHLLLQIRMKVLNGDFKQIFSRWYPGIKMEENEEKTLLVA